MTFIATSRDVDLGHQYKFMPGLTEWIISNNNNEIVSSETLTQKKISEFFSELTNKPKPKKMTAKDLNKMNLCELK